MSDHPDIEEPAEEPAAESAADDDAQGVLDLDERRLCSDGSCTGVIGADGRCRECGRAAGDPEAGAGAEAEALPEPDDEVGDEQEDEAEPEGASPEDQERELCPDGNCVGLIGAGGACKVCGARREGAGPA